MKKKMLSRIKDSDIGLRIVKGISWSMIGSILGKGLMLISFMFVARILGKEEYGKVSIIRSTVMMFMTFSSMGMGLTASRYIAYYRDVDKQKTYQIYKASNFIALFFASFISIIVFFFSDYISNISFGASDLSIPLKISVITLFFSTMFSAQNGALNGFEYFKSIGINTSIYGFIQALLIIFGAYIYGLNGVILGLGFSAILLCILYNFSLRKIFKKLNPNYITRIFDSEIKSIFVGFSIPVVLSGLVSVPILWWTKTYLIRNTNFEEMAIFDVAEQWNFMILFIPSSISGIILPLLTNTLAVGTKDQYSRLIKINLVINGGITLLLVLIVIPFAPFILKLYGNSFINYLPLRIMLICAILQAINTVLGQVIVSKGKMWIGLGVNLLWGIWLILYTYLFVYKLSLGALGLSYAMLCSYIFHSITQSLIAVKAKI